METAGLAIVPTDDDWREAWGAYARGQASDAGIVDHVSFVVMRRLAITDAFTNDRHFKAAGFNTLY
jgi:predicted nucleic acid-binding protein